jgi:hypothetical protein
MSPSPSDDEGMFSSLGDHHESLLSPTMFLELSDVVYGWMSELQEWTGYDVPCQHVV